MRILDLISSLSLYDGNYLIGMFHDGYNLRYLDEDSFDVLEFWEFLESLNKFDYTDELELVPDPNERVLILNTGTDDEQNPVPISNFIDLLKELWISYGNLEVFDTYTASPITSVVEVEDKPEVILL